MGWQTLQDYQKREDNWLSELASGSTKSSKGEPFMFVVK